MQLRIAIFILAVLNIAFAANSNGQSAKDHRLVAVTVDDLPAVGLLDGEDSPASCDSSLYIAFTEDLLQQLRSVPATGFVNEGARICETLRPTLLPRLLNAWLDEGHDLGNHTFSHRAFEDIGRDAFQIDVLRGEITTSHLLDQRGRQIRYFRYPYLHAPADSRSKASFEAFLNSRQYVIAPVTVEGDEWIYAVAFAKAKERGETQLAERVGADYLRYMEEVFDFSESFSRHLFSREIPQILLIHANRLNANYFDELKESLLARGCRFVTLGEAMSDEVYERDDPYVGKRGLSWLQRLAVGIEAHTRREPTAPEWVRSVAGI